MAAPKKKNTQPPATIQNFPIVGIGASAGGLDAFKRLLKAIPEDSGMAYVLVQHLDPSHESILPEILSRTTNIPVHEITDDIKLAPNHIYIIPSNKILISTDGVLKLAIRDKKILTLSIDIFLNSLAEVHKELAIGVVLSGTGSDGTFGLKAIKEYGGITLAQDSKSAAFDSMPQSAINAGVVDFVLPPEEMPAQLLQIVSSYKTNHIFKEEDELPKDDDYVYKQILLILRQRSGVDFTYYKQPTLHRRIARRIAIVKKKNLADYLKFLRSDKAEQNALFQDLLIPVTSFFRDPKTFNTLCESVLPALFRNKNAEEPFRVWIAGCSTGQEAFSIAICLHEFLSTKLSQTRIQIFASDISEIAIKTARTAYYSKADVKILSEERLKNYFKKNNGGYEVNKEIRDMCVFAPHNFLKDPPFAKMDLISCRNVLIYMDNFLQKKALTVFHYALKENGILLLGKSESTSPASELFTLFDKHDKIYTRKSVPGRFIHVATERKEENLVLKNKILKPEATQTDFRKSADAILLSKFAPVSVVVNEQMDIVHIQGNITPFLEQPQGKPTFNLMKMAREGLAFELRNALHKAKISKEPIIKENIPTKINDNQSIVSFQVIPLTDTVDQNFLIVFEEKALPVLEKKSTVLKTQNGDAQKRYEQLEKELSQTREDMRSITEDMEAANEELQSANEEMQSSNEEMQSLNEELETSREELQSTNEELTIVNHELIDKQEQLNLARIYSEAIVDTLREPLIILNKSMRIITANASFYKKFNTEEQDVEGKLFYEIQNNQWDDDTIRLLLEKILPQKTQLTDFEIILDFPKLGKRHLLMNAKQVVNEKTAAQLILLAIEDITDKVNSKKLIEANALLIHNIYMNAPASICTFKGPTHIYELVNPAYQKLFTKRDLLGKPLLEALPELEGQGVDKILDNVYNTGEIFKSTEIPVILAREDNVEPEQRYFNTTMQPIYNEENKIIGVVNFGFDVTEQITARKLIEASEAKFRALSETIPHMIWTATPDGKKNFFNKYFLEYTGKTFEELTDSGFRKIIFPDDLEKDLQLWHHSLKTGEDFYIEKRIRHHNGTYQWHISRGIAQKDEQGNIIGWVGSSTNIDEHKILTQELTEAKVFAEKATLIAEDEKAKSEIALQSKQQFLSNMSHEIRTPMNAIIGFTKVLEKTDLTLKQKEYLNAIKSSGNTLIVLINDILDLAKVDSGKMTFINLPFKIAESINTMIHLFETKIQEKNLELVKEYDSRIPEILLGDSTRLHQILINLLSNALKFTAKGKIIVSVSLLNEDNEKVSLEIKIADTGIGIPENKIKSIFEDFEQAYMDTSRVYGGTGLGLAIVKQLVEKQGGTIAVKSKRDEGSTFSFILGFHKTNDAVEPEDVIRQYETEIKPLKILVVEDVKLNQLLMRSILDDFKFDWDIAENGKIAIEKLQTNSYDIILMDLQMPIMNGFEATEHIRNKMNLQTPIIALTADVTTVDLEKCKAVGMNDYISKPLDEKLLYKKITDLVK